MSLKFIHDFQIRIYKLMASTKEISSKIDKIYLSVAQDAKYPFLLISIINVQNKSKFDQGIYEVDFEIAAFARDKNQGILVSLADNINLVLIAKDCHFDSYTIAGLNLTNVGFVQSPDLVTTKLAMNYKALLKKE